MWRVVFLNPDARSLMWPISISLLWYGLSSKLLPFDIESVMVTVMLSCWCWMGTFQNQYHHVCWCIFVVGVELQTKALSVYVAWSLGLYQNHYIPSCEHCISHFTSLKHVLCTYCDVLVTVLSATTAKVTYVNHSDSIFIARPVLTHSANVSLCCSLCMLVNLFL